MKTNFTLFITRTFILTFIFASSVFGLSAQTTHNVTVTDGQFTPKDLVIEVGDKVVWTNVGTNAHNVNGTQTTFSSNPESFGNDVGLGWTYEHVFNTVGLYNYQCDPHALFGMVGTVTVNQATDVEQFADESSFHLYPNPATDYTDLKLSGKSGKSSVLKIYSITGKLVDQKVLPGNIESFRYHLNYLKQGAYFLELSLDNKKSIHKLLKQ